MPRGKAPAIVEEEEEEDVEYEEEEEEEYLTDEGQVTLREYQLPHYERLMRILVGEDTPDGNWIPSINMGALDTSPTRAGKMVVACYMAQQMNLKLLVVCPKVVKEFWRRWASRMGVEMVSIWSGRTKKRNKKNPEEDFSPLSYQAFRGTAEKIGKTGNPTGGFKHDLLEHYDEERVLSSGERRVTTKMQATEYALDLIHDGILLVYDEAHQVFSGINSKITRQTEAALALARAVYETAEDEDLPVESTRSRVLCLTATPAGKPDKIPRIMQMMGLVMDENMFERNPPGVPGVQLTGYTELYEVAYEVNPVEAQRIQFEMMAPPASKAKIIKATQAIWERILRQVMSSAMAVPKSNFPMDVKNGFYELPPEDAARHRRAESRLARAVGFREDASGRVRMTVEGDAFSYLAIGYREMAGAKRSTMARLAREILEALERSKVICYLRYTWDILYVAYFLKGVEEMSALVNLVGELRSANSAQLTRLQEQVTEAVGDVADLVEDSRAKRKQKDAFLDLMDSLLDTVDEYAPDDKEGNNKYDNRLQKILGDLFVVNFPFRAGLPKVGLMFGQTSEADRVAAIDEFQEDNGNLRVIIANPNAGGIGIELSDLEGAGGWERFILLMPDNEFKSLVQAMNRASNPMRKSRVTVRYIYANEGQKEMKMLNALVAKGNVMKTIVYDTGQGTPDNMVLPENFPAESEADFTNRLLRRDALQRVTSD